MKKPIESGENTGGDSSDGVFEMELPGGFRVRLRGAMSQSKYTATHLKAPPG